MQPLSRHAAFFTSLQRVEDRLASEQHNQEQERRSEPSPSADTMTASPFLFLDPAPAPAPSTAAADRHSSGAALDFLTEQDQRSQQLREDGASDDDDDDDNGEEEDIARLMALLGLSPPRDGGGSSSAGCDCSGADGFLAKVVGVVGPKCHSEKRRLDAWIHHYHHHHPRPREGGGCREPARLAHLLVAKASTDTPAVAFPATVKDFLDRDAPPHWTEADDGSPDAVAS